MKRERATDLTLISGFNASHTIMESFDPENETILYEKDNYVVIYDLNTGLKIKTIEVGNIGNVQLYRNFLINSNGLQITLPD